MRLDELAGGRVIAHLDALVALLGDAIDSGASVSFLAATPRAALAAYWAAVADELNARRCRMVAAFEGDRLVGAVQLKLDTPPNQPHRAEVAKLLVHRASRRQGLGRRLMDTIEAIARAEDRTLLTLDTQTGSDAERLYAALGWTRAGTIPAYALRPDGTLAGTTLFYKLTSAGER